MSFHQPTTNGGWKLSSWTSTGLQGRESQPIAAVLNPKWVSSRWFLYVNQVGGSIDWFKVGFLYYSDFYFFLIERHRYIFINFTRVQRLFYMLSVLVNKSFYINAKYYRLFFIFILLGWCGSAHHLLNQLLLKKIKMRVDNC
jgi:hypothetical protein